MIGERIVEFLRRNDAHETWVYERRVVLFVEFLCLLAGVLVAPNQTAAMLLLIDLPRSLYATELARAARSGAARKAEKANALGVAKVELACERNIEQAAKNQQIMTAAQPIVALAMTIAGSGGQGMTSAVVVGFAVSVVRLALVEGYSVWRAWYRERVPVKIAAA